MKRKWTYTLQGFTCRIDDVILTVRKFPVHGVSKFCIKKRAFDGVIWTTEVSMPRNISLHALKCHCVAKAKKMGLIE